MFFRRERPKEITFEDRLAPLRQAGFPVQPESGGRVKILRDCYAAVIENTPAGPRVAERAGLVMAGGIGKLIDGGYQKFFLTPGGERKPALASELKGIHAFQED